MVVGVMPNWWLCITEVTNAFLGWILLLSFRNFSKNFWRHCQCKTSKLSFHGSYSMNSIRKLTVGTFRLKATSGFKGNSPEMIIAGFTCVAKENHHRRKGRHLWKPCQDTGTFFGDHTVINFGLLRLTFVILHEQDLSESFLSTVNLSEVVRVRTFNLKVSLLDHQSHSAYYLNHFLVHHSPAKKRTDFVLSLMLLDSLGSASQV